MKKPNYKYNKLTPHYERLAHDHEALHEMCARTDKVVYRILKQEKNLPPEKYEITYRVKSIVGIDQSQQPIYGNEHRVEITITGNYLIEGAKCFATSKVWHPNIRFHNMPIGKICVNQKVLGSWHSLEQLVIFIGEMLQYKNYHAIDTDPFPEDMEVARWVRNFAEPQGIIGSNKPVDARNLLLPMAGAEPMAPTDTPNTIRNKIKIKTVRRGDNNTSIPASSPTTFNNGKIKITVRNK